MKSLIEASYSPIERGGVNDVESLVDRLVSGKMPAFIIENAGISLKKALAATHTDAILRANGYTGDIKTSVRFSHRVRRVLPNELKGVSYPKLEEWAESGVTSLHTDQHRVDQEPELSLNLTEVGRSEFRLHPSRLQPDQLDDQWDILDEQTGDLLWHSLADPALIAPEGYRSLINPRDLLVFDPLNAHVVRSLESPRISEATFFQKLA